MHLKIGHGHEKRHRKESYVVFIPKKYSHFEKIIIIIQPSTKNNTKCSKITSLIMNE